MAEGLSYRHGLAPDRQDEPPNRPETAEERRERLTWEAEMIAEAEAELAAGQGISQADANAWLDSWTLTGPCRSHRGLDPELDLRAAGAA